MFRAARVTRAALFLCTFPFILSTHCSLLLTHCSPRTETLQKRPLYYTTPKQNGLHPKNPKQPLKQEEVMKTSATFNKPSNQHLWQTFKMEDFMKTPTATKIVNKLWLILVTVATLLLGACSQQPMPKETENLESQLIPTFWKQLGSALDVNPANNSRSPSIAVNSTGNLFAAWTEDTTGSNGYKVMVKRWVAAPFNSWVSMGTALNVDPKKFAITRPDGAIAVTGSKPVVAFHECTTINFPSTCNVYVKRWDGAAWGLLGGKLNFNNGYYASVALDSQNNPVVAWFERALGGYNIYVKRWNGAAWVSLGPVPGANPALNPSSGNLASMPSLAVKNDKIAVAWQQCAIPVSVSGNPSPFTCRHQILARSYDATTNKWKEFLGSAGAVNVNTSRDAKLPSLELTSTGTPIVAFVECVQANVACHENSDHNVYVKRYGTKTVGGFVIFGFHLLGNALDVNILAASKWPSLALSPNNAPMVAWSEGSSTGAGFAGIRVKRWIEGSASWQFNSGVSGASLNISQTQHGDEASLAISSTGTPSVAFFEAQEGGNGILANIYVRQLQQQ